MMKSYFPKQLPVLKLDSFFRNVQLHKQREKFEILKTPEQGIIFPNNES